MAMKMACKLGLLTTKMALLVINRVISPLYMALFFGNWSYFTLLFLGAPCPSSFWKPVATAVNNRPRHHMPVDSTRCQGEDGWMLWSCRGHVGYLEDHPTIRGDTWLITMVIISPQNLGLWDPFQMA